MTTEKYNHKVDEISYYCDMGIRTLGFIEGQVTRQNDDTVLNIIQMHADGMKGILKVLLEYKENIINLSDYAQNKDTKEQAKK